MHPDDAIFRQIVEQLGSDPNAGKTSTEQKIEVFNFNALKGTIDANEEFRTAVAGLKNFKQNNPGAFAEVEEGMIAARDAKHERLGIAGMTPEQILDSVFDDVNKLPLDARAAELAKIAKVKKATAQAIDELGRGNTKGRA